MLTGAAAAPRKRGRPKGATNRRARDLKGYIEAAYGASAAQQSASLCMVTRSELKTAGGSMAKAQVNKALALVDHVRRAQDGLDERLRQLVLDALRELATEAGAAKGAELRGLVTTFIHRVKEAGSGFGLAQALKLITDERAALMPYTDQKQPLAVEQVGDGWRPSVVIEMQGGAPGALAQMVDVDIIDVFEAEVEQVSHTRSHDEAQTLALPGFEADPPAD